MNASYWIFAGERSMSMKLSLSTFAWFNHTIEKAIKMTAELGYEGIEIEGNRPHLLPTDYTDKDLKRIKQLLKDNNLRCPCITAFDGTHFWCLSTPAKKVYRDTIQHVKDCVKMADILEAKVVESVTGKPLFVEDDRVEAWNRVRDAYLEITDWIDKKGYDVTIGLENEDANCVETIDDTLRMLKDVNHPRLRALLDLGHANMESYMTVSDAIRKLAPWICHIHADDNDGYVHRHLPLGEGKINWEMTVKTLKEINYQGWVSVEMEMVKDPISASYNSLLILKRYL